MDAFLNISKDFAEDVADMVASTFVYFSDLSLGPYVWHAAAGCILLPISLKYFLRQRSPSAVSPDMGCLLSKIHYFAGSAPEYENTQRCMALLKKYPGAVNMPFSSDYHLSHGYTPFLRACWNNNFELIHFMLLIGADVNCTSSDGETCLYLVAYRVSKSRFWDPRALNLLWEKGCSVDAVNVYNNSMLHLAAKAGHVTLTRWLVLHGADPDIINCAGYTPRKLALKKGSRDHIIVAELLKHPAKDKIYRCLVAHPDRFELVKRSDSFPVDALSVSTPTTPTYFSQPPVKVADY